MRAGDLRHLVMIQERTSAQDDFGAPVETWSRLAVVWADIQPLRGREYHAAEQINAEVTHRIVIRYRSGILPTMRVVYNDRVFGIESVIDPGERSEALELMCIERNPEAT